jgi:hypothetical protein
VDKSEGNRALGRPKGRWEDNIKMDLYDSDGGASTGLMRLRWQALMIAVMSHWVQ